MSNALSPDLIHFLGDFIPEFCQWPVSEPYAWCTWALNKLYFCIDLYTFHLLLFFAMRRLWGVFLWGRRLRLWGLLRRRWSWFYLVWFGFELLAAHCGWMVCELSLFRLLLDGRRDEEQWFTGWSFCFISFHVTVKFYWCSWAIRGLWKLYRVAFSTTNWTIHAHRWGGGAALVPDS